VTYHKLDPINKTSMGIKYLTGVLVRDGIVVGAVGHRPRGQVMGSHGGGSWKE